MVLKLPDGTNLLLESNPLRLTPMSIRFFVDGCTMANCLLQRKLTYAFLGAIPTSTPKPFTASMMASNIVRRSTLPPEYC